MRSPSLPVGGGDDAHVDLRRELLRADALNLPVLEKPEQERLHLQAHLADFVEEDGAPVCLLEPPGLSRCASVKLPRTWPNSSDARSVSGTPAQLIVTSGARASAALLMNQLRDDFLADAALPGDQHLRVGSARVLDLFADQTGCAAGADEMN